MLDFKHWLATFPNSVAFQKIYFFCALFRHLIHKYLVKDKNTFLAFPLWQQWVKNLTVVPQVVVKVHVQSPAWHCGLKDPAFPQM